MSAPVQILGLGNPLLDLTVTVDPKFLEKYELDPNLQYIANEKTLPLFNELETMPGKKMIPGGSSQNAIRAAQWVLKTPGSTAFAGCVSDDEFGRAQRDILSKEGVVCGYDTTKKESTGTCAAMIIGNNRCLVANIGAANHFRAAHMFEEPLPKLIESAKIFYCESFFVTVSMESLLIAAHHALTHPDKYFSMNLSAKWVIESQLRSLLELIPYADFIFCNEEEARCFARQMRWTEQHDIPTIASSIALFPKLNPSKHRIVVITQGSDPVVMATARFNVDCAGKDIADDDAIPRMGGGKYCAHYAKEGETGCPAFVQQRVQVQQFPVTPIPKEEMKDTNGCGDSFVGAFLASFVSGRTPEQCVANGNKMAQIIARADGCVFPEKKDFVL